MTELLRHKVAKWMGSHPKIASFIEKHVIASHQYIIMSCAQNTITLLIGKKHLFIGSRRSCANYLLDLGKLVSQEFKDILYLVNTCHC